MIYWRSMPEDCRKAEQTACAQQILAEALKREYQMSALPRIEKTESGKPYFADYPEIQFNYSHCRTMAVCVLSSARTGIDIETIRPFHERTARRFCCDREWNWLKGQEDQDLAWIRIWTLKEAYLKYTGTGIRTDLKQLDILDVLESRTEQKTIWDHGKQVSLYAESIQNGREWISVFGEQKINTTMCCV
mgnify:CR=1 FL=1